MSRMPTKLNEQHREFCRAYLETLSTSAAAVRAGYSSSYGSKLLKLDFINAELDRLRAELEEDSVLTTRRVLELLSEIAEDSAEETRDRLKALDQAARHLGMYKDQVHVTGEVTADQMRALLGIGGES